MSSESSQEFVDKNVEPNSMINVDVSLRITVQDARSIQVGVSTDAKNTVHVFKFRANDRNCRIWVLDQLIVILAGCKTAYRKKQTQKNNRTHKTIPYFSNVHDLQRSCS